jgi:hypothetical protein
MRPQDAAHLLVTVLCDRKSRLTISKADIVGHAPRASGGIAPCPYLVNA